MRELVLATGNADKVREIRAILEGLPFEVVGLERWPDVVPPEETGATFAENAILKARYYAAATGLLVVAEDSGLEIDALDGAPGVQSARFAGADTPYPDKFAEIYRRLSATGSRNSSARFVCELALAENDRILFQARGTVEGRIAQKPRGTHGFGYDPIFFYPPAGRTLAELTDGEKHAVSHRGAAFAKLRVYLQGL
jgi:XTP/dITP diphosphohydrolase